MIKADRVKILILCHDNCEYISNDIIQPVQVGTSSAQNIISGMLHDNEGDNISGLASQYMEVTAQYWAWKNLDLDYYGFFKPSTYLSFCHLDEPYDSYGSISRPYIYPGISKELNLDEKSILEAIDGYDIILSEKKDLKKMPRKVGRSLRQEYLTGEQRKTEDLDLMAKVLHDLHPECDCFCEKYLNGHKTYLANMFIMNKAIFNEYMSWLMEILEECDRRLDHNALSATRTRMLGDFSERLFNIYLMWLMSERNIKVKELQNVFFHDIDPDRHPTPAFERDNVAIALSANEYYVPYVATMLESLKDNISSDHNYDILIMTKDILDNSRSRIQSLFSEYKNVSVRFLDVSVYEARFKNVFLKGHFVLETWFRLLMPEMLENYSKVLYLDSDLLVCDDLADLYDTDVTGYFLAASLDADTAGLYNGFEPNKRSYMNNVLKIKEPYKYFQAGVIVFNLDEFRKRYTTDEMLEFALSNEWELLDQDVLNYLTQGNVKYVDMAWNVMYDWRNIRITQIISRAPRDLYDMYMEARKHPKIIHFAGPEKPWHDPRCDYAEYFWKYARRSPYYETILQRMPHIKNEAVSESFRSKLRKFLETKLDSAFPKYTYRREVLKSIWRVGGNE